MTCFARRSAADASPSRFLASPTGSALSLIMTKGRPRRQGSFSLSPCDGLKVLRPRGEKGSPAARSRIIGSYRNPGKIGRFSRTSATGAVWRKKAARPSASAARQRAATPSQGGKGGPVSQGQRNPRRLCGFMRVRARFPASLPELQGDP
jgi:hypothetical protein